MSLDINLYAMRKVSVFSTNMTHNLSVMATACGLYEAVWRPDENGYKYARDIIEVLERGLVELKANPETYKEYNAPNGWGTYEHFVPFIVEYLEQCIANPDAEISVWR